MPDDTPLRRALVVGGSRGIGRAVVQRLATDDFEVHATGRDAASLDELAKTFKEHGLTVHATAADATEEGDWSSLQESLPEIDTLVLCAGTSTSAPLARATLTDWNSQMSVNATAAFLGMRTFVPGMAERGFGRVVVVASTAGVRGSPYISGYAASKHAVIGLVRSAAVEVGPAVTVNAVCPHFVDTDMTDASVQRIADTTGREPHEARAILERASLLGRLIRPQEVAAAVAYLASKLAAPVNGQALVLDGGETR